MSCYAVSEERISLQSQIGNISKFISPKKTQKCIQNIKSIFSSKNMGLQRSVKGRLGQTKEDETAKIHKSQSKNQEQPFTLKCINHPNKKVSLWFRPNISRSIQKLTVETFTVPVVRLRWPNRMQRYSSSNSKNKGTKRMQTPNKGGSRPRSSRKNNLNNVFMRNNSTTWWLPKKGASPAIWNRAWRSVLFILKITP